MVAAMASRFTKGSRGSRGKAAAPPSPRPGINSSAPPSPASVATAHTSSSSLTSSAEKPSRWRALFGSPSRRRPSPQDRAGPRRHCSVMDTAGMPAAGGSSGCAADFSAASCSSSPASYLRQPSPAPALAAGAAGEAAVPGPVVDSPRSVRPLSTCKQQGGGSSSLMIATGGHEASGELHKLPLTPQSAAAAEAARASGACSPLKAHARNLSLPSKLMLVGAGSTDVSPAPSPNPVCQSGSSSPAHSQRQQQPEAAARSGSPSRLGSSSRVSSSGGGGGGAAPCAADASASASSSSTAPSSHSQLLAEALQLEVLARSLSQGGRHEEAEAALRNSLAMISKQLGPGHPNTVAATTRLALHLNRNSKHTEAERLLRQVLTHKQAMLGRKHPQVAAACINLAACLYSQGHYNAAVRLYSTALEVRKASLGDTHADTAACLNNLALCFSRWVWGNGWETGSWLWGVCVTQVCVCHLRMRSYPSHPSLCRDADAVCICAALAAAAAGCATGPRRSSCSARRCRPVLQPWASCTLMLPPPHTSWATAWASWGSTQRRWCTTSRAFGCGSSRSTGAARSSSSRPLRQQQRAAPGLLGAAAARGAAATRQRTWSPRTAVWR